MSDYSQDIHVPAEQDSRWQAVLSRDSDFDGQFFYSVKTTGIYCRPSCAARLPKPENVRFHASCEVAEQAGFRACKRCKPNEISLRQQHAAKIAEICRAIETVDKIPQLEELADQAGMSVYHFHRLFKAHTGLTPRAFATAHRAREELTKSGATVTQAIYDAGFHSSSRFYEKSDEVLGMTPTNYRAGGANTQIHFAIGETSLGCVLVARSEKGVCAILLGDEPDELARNLQDRFPNADLIGGETRFEEWVARVVGMVENPSLGLDLPLDVRGTAFQQRVWQALREIPVGTTATYTQIANKIDAPKAVRAVAGACAANALAIAIPCHRVVRNDGNLSGYRWGVERKRELLKREGNNRS